MTTEKQPDNPEKKPSQQDHADHNQQKEEPKEIGGRTGPDPVRYGDWENKGKCVDF